MITLSPNPPSVNTVLGGNAPVAYDKMVLSPYQTDPFGKTIQGTVKLSSTTDPNVPIVQGTFSISIPNSELILNCLPISYRKIVLSAGQKSAVQTIIDNSQNSLEAGFITVGAVSGTQSPGA